MPTDQPPADKPPTHDDARILWRQWAMNEALVARGYSSAVFDPDALFKLADRIFAWVMEE
jgi:hypothetical protein